MEPKTDFTDILKTPPADLVGRRRELELLISILMAEKHVLLEGAPGTSKSTLLRHVTQQLDLPLFQVEGSADLTPAKLIGTFNPSLVLEKGFDPAFFEPGPLFHAMEQGGILYIDELNRAAPDATNTLIRAMEEKEVVVPRYGTLTALPTFRVVAAMNPFDDTGVTRVSRALFDRVCRMKMEYQNADEEYEIATLNAPEAPNSITKFGVSVARLTRSDERLRQGASVRGAIDFAHIAQTLAVVRGGHNQESIIDAALSAFTGKIWLENPSNSPEEVILEIVAKVLRDAGRGLFHDLNDESAKKATGS